MPDPYADLDEPTGLHAEHITAIATQANAGDDDITVDSTEGALEGAKVTIILDNASVFTSTVASITSATVFVLTDPIPASRHADVDGVVTFYQTGPDVETEHKVDGYIDFEWDNSDDAIKYELRYKKVTAKRWKVESIEEEWGSITDPVFTGTGTTLMSTSGSFNGGTDTTFKVQIDSVGDNDTFSWRHWATGTAEPGTWEATGINTNALDCVYLDFGISVQWDDITGSVQNDYWTWTADAQQTVTKRVSGLDCNVEYQWQLRSISGTKQHSKWATPDYTITSWAPRPPEDIIIDETASNFTGQFPYLAWTGVSNSQSIVKKIEIRRGATWATGTLVKSLQANDTNHVLNGIKWDDLSHSAITFSGAGNLTFVLNAASNYNGTESRTYVIKIDGVSNQNTFTWSDTNGEAWNAVGVSITGNAQSLNNGITVDFSGTTGGQLNDTYTFYARRSITLWVAAQNEGNGYSANPDSITLTNLPPDMSAYNPVGYADNKKITCDWSTFSAPEDIDSYSIYKSTETTVSIIPQNLVGSTKGKSYSIPVNKNEQKIKYDIRLVPYDSLCKDGKGRGKTSL